MELRHHIVILIFILINQETVKSQEVSTTVTNPPQSSVSNVTQAVTEVAAVTSAVSSSVQSVVTTVETSASTASADVVSPVVTEEQSAATNSTENTTTSSILTTLSTSTLSSSENLSTTTQSISSTESSSVSSVSPVSIESSSVINTTEITEKAINDTTAVTVTTELNNVTAEVTNNTNDNQSVIANGDNLKESTTTHSLLTGPLDIQTQLYIISGVFGAVVFLLILLVLTLALSVAKIKDQLCDSEARYVPGKEQIHGYQNGAFNGGGDVVRGVNERSVDKDNHNDLKDLGYTIYNGKGHSRENVYKVNDPVGGGDQGENIPLDSVSSGRRQMMKYEEGVIPMADEEHGRNYR